MEPQERIEFLYNQMALLLAGALGGDEMLRGLNTFGEDHEPLVLSTVLSGLDGVREAFVPRESEAAFAIYVRRTLGPAMEWVGYEAKPGEDETMNLIRPRLIAYLGDEGQDPAAKAFAKKTAAAYLENPKSVDPALASVSLRLAAHDGDRAMFEEYKARLEGAETPTERRRFLGTLGRFRDPELREAALAYALEGSLRPQEMFAVTWGVEGTPEGHDRVYEWMTENYDTIVDRIPPMFASFMPFFAGGCSAERLESARAFFSDPSHQAAGTLKQLEKVADQVTDCLNLREREGEAVTRYLNTLSEETGDE
jgi:alanyl aminopeptidase